MGARTGGAERAGGCRSSLSFSVGYDVRRTETETTDRPPLPVALGGDLAGIPTGGAWAGAAGCGEDLGRLTGFHLRLHRFLGSRGTVRRNREESTNEDDCRLRTRSLGVAVGSDAGRCADSGGSARDRRAAGRPVRLGGGLRDREGSPRCGPGGVPPACPVPRSTAS